MAANIAPGVDGRLTQRFAPAARAGGFWDEYEEAKHRRPRQIGRAAVIAVAVATFVAAASGEVRDWLDQGPQFSEQDSRDSLDEITGILEDLQAEPLEGLIQGG